MDNVSVGTRAVGSRRRFSSPYIGDVALSDACQTLPLPGQTVQRGWILYGKAEKCPSSQF